MDANYDWRANYEDFDSDKDRVVDVIRYDGVDVGYTYMASSGDICVATSCECLVKKAKPKYRPYKRHELSCGDVFLHKESGEEAMLLHLSDRIASLAGSIVGFPELLEHYTRLDGMPAGVLDVDMPF